MWSVPDPLQQSDLSKRVIWKDGTCMFIETIQTQSRYWYYE